jgi:heat shock protein HtpX
MTDHQQPVLVYNRIDQNRRNTVALLAFVPLLLLPFAAGIVVYMLPWLLLVIGPQLALSAGLSHQLLIEHPLAFEVLATITAAAIVLGIMTAETLWNVSLFRSAMLRATGATPLSREREPDLWRIVENLCIGAGLPLPRLYLVDSPVPNAFATGTDPAHASLGITQGLLELLDRRELEGVIAHELSHIGNQDTRLSTAVAAVIASLRLPIGIVTGISRALGVFRAGLGALFLFVFFGFVALMSTMSVASLDYLSFVDVPRWVLWRQVFVTVAPWYVLLGAPAIGLFVRQAISRQREFLADADAVVLTRDPEGLALALAKIGAWSGPKTFNVGPAAAHLCIADPLPTDTPWWDTIFPCHPSMQARIALLSRMGNGIPDSTLQVAAKTGAMAGQQAVYDALPVSVEYQKPRIRVRGWTPSGKTSGSAAGISTQRHNPGGTPLYEKADGWSNVLGNLPDRAVVTLCGTEGHFLRVTTTDGVVGYISQSARAHVIAHVPS